MVPGVLRVLAKLSNTCIHFCDEEMKTPERSVILMYGRSNSATHIASVNLDLFARKQRLYNDTPPAKATLVEHRKCAG